MAGLLFLAYVLWRDLGALVMVRMGRRTAALVHLRAFRYSSVPRMLIIIVCGSAGCVLLS